MQSASRGHRVRRLRVLIVVAATLALFAIPAMAQAASFDVGLDVTVSGSPGGGDGPQLPATGFSSLQWFGLGLVTLVGGAWAVAYGSRPFRTLQKGGAR